MFDFLLLCVLFLLHSPLGGIAHGFAFIDEGYETPFLQTWLLVNSPPLLLCCVEYVKIENAQHVCKQSILDCCQNMTAPISHDPIQYYQHEDAPHRSLHHG